MDSDYEFAFTGIEIEDEGKQVDLDKKKTEAGFVSLEDMFRKYSKRELDPEKDTILNAIWQNALATKQQQEMYAEPVPGQEGAEDPFAQYKSMTSNPILDASMEYINNHWGIK